MRNSLSSFLGASVAEGARTMEKPSQTAVTSPYEGLLLSPYGTLKISVRIPAALPDDASVAVIFTAFVLFLGMVSFPEADIMQPSLGCTAARITSYSLLFTISMVILTEPAFSWKARSFALAVMPKLFGSGGVAGYVTEGLLPSPFSAYATEHIDSAIAMASIIVITRFIVFPPC